MADLIDRQAALEVLNRLAREKFSLRDEFQYYLNALIDVEDKIKALPSAQPEIKCIAKIILTDEQVQEAFKKAKKEILAAQPERKKGKWIYLNGLDAFECSVCGRQMVRNIFDYCPWCGAEMTKGEEDDVERV